VTLAIFYKPLVPAMWYGLAHVLDDEGWMLHHNILTDTLVAAVMLLFSVWFAFAFAAALPVLVCFFYYTIVLFIPVIAYYAINEKSIKANKWDIEDMREEERDERTATMLLSKRLSAYTLFASVVFAMLLWPFYLSPPTGQSYTAVATNTANILGISLSFWTPDWPSGFGWPFNLHWPQQFTLAVSIGAIGVEQTMFFWNYLYFWAYGPRNSTAYGGWTLGKQRHKNFDSGNALTGDISLEVDLETGTATAELVLAVGEEQTSFEATGTVQVGDLESALGQIERGKSSKLLDTQDGDSASWASLKAENARVEKENARVEKENVRLQIENARVEKENARIEKENQQLKSAAEARGSSVFSSCVSDCSV
jgi:hypothetical protein